MNKKNPVGVVDVILLGTGNHCHAVYHKGVLQGTIRYDDMDEAINLTKFFDLLIPPMEVTYAKGIFLREEDRKNPPKRLQVYPMNSRDYAWVQYSEGLR